MGPEAEGVGAAEALPSRAADSASSKCGAPGVSPLKPPPHPKVASQPGGKPARARKLEIQRKHQLRTNMVLKLHDIQIVIHMLLIELLVLPCVYRFYLSIVSSFYCVLIVLFVLLYNVSDCF